ncbi:DinB family protein [Paenibacillus glufosinatiresistens]|uniref:DinB family protein n=1 Tax=Paenibacillus glufosinatiresistens TaxID=3070657 RepID=UPI0038CD2A7E
MGNQELGMSPSYVIGGLPGYTPEVGRLISMMNYARYTTLSAVQGLSVSELDELLDEKSNSIGALLMHFAAVDHIYRVETFEEREMTEEETAFWQPALNLGDEGRTVIKGHPLEYYLKLLEETRERTLEAFRKVDDEWLFREEPFWDGQPANRYFMWFHVFEDEINHRGQIRLQRKRLGRAMV